MINVSGVGAGVFGHASVSFRAATGPRASQAYQTQVQQPSSSRALLQLHYLREALEAMKPRRLTLTQVAPQPAAAVSTSALDLSSNVGTQIASSEEINTAPTSFQHNGPAWNGSTVTAPWSGASTAHATVGGSYDGSSGQGRLTFEVRRAGTHGGDDLRIRVYRPDGSTLERIDINKNDPLNQVYELSNGLTIALGAGELINRDTFEVDTTLLSTSYTPSDPGWTGSTAMPSIGGVYDGSNGSGALKFQVRRAGVHTEDDLQLRVYDPADSLIETINVRKNDPVDKVYNLSNGLSFTLGDGELIKHETFQVAVDASQATNYTTHPAWEFGSSTATVTGTYNGSHGQGTLTFQALDNGVHGTDDLRVRVYEPDGSTLQTISVRAGDPLNKPYDLVNGLAVTFSAGNMIKHETFTVDLQTQATFSTDPNSVESTAQPALSGVYGGSLGTDTLTFTVTSEGTHGTDHLSLDVHASDGTFLESIVVNATDPIGQSYTLNNGLDFTLGVGSLALNETFTLDVNHLVPTTVNPQLSMNGIGLHDPKLEDRFVVTDGSFKINGTLIDVFANDSINSILDRINSAGIDVTALFDASSDRIVLTRDTPGEANDIVLSDDTSGFLAATKLAAAVSQAGNGDENSILSSLGIMSSVSSGSLIVNGAAIALDVDTDSLVDVLARIEQSVANVTATFDPMTGRVSIKSNDSADLSISSGGTGFFQALQMSEGSYDYVQGTTHVSRGSGFSSRSRRLTIEAIEEFSRHLNRLFDDSTIVNTTPVLDQIRTDFKNTIKQVFQSESDRVDTQFGLQFDFSGRRNEVFRFSDSRIQQTFSRQLRSATGANEFQRLLFGATSSEDGLIDQLLALTKSAEQDLLNAGGTSIFVDLLV